MNERRAAPRELPLWAVKVCYRDRRAWQRPSVFTVRARRPAAAVARAAGAYFATLRQLARGRRVYGCYVKVERVERGLG